MPAQTRLFRCLKDNYGVLVHDAGAGLTASIDAPLAAASLSRPKNTPVRVCWAHLLATWVMTRVVS